MKAPSSDGASILAAPAPAPAPAPASASASAFRASASASVPRQRQRQRQRNAIGVGRYVDASGLESSSVWLVSTRPPPPRSSASLSREWAACLRAPLGLGGAFAPGFALRARAAAGGVGPGGLRSCVWRRIGRDARHREWAGGELCAAVWGRPSGTRSRARASRPSLRALKRHAKVPLGYLSPRSPTRTLR